MLTFGNIELILKLGEFGLRCNKCECGESLYVDSDGSELESVVGVICFVFVFFEGPGFGH